MSPTVTEGVSPPPFELGFVLAGAVSAGAYTSGVMDFMIEALQAWEDARAQGYRASLLVQHRPNIFEQKVANIEPGKRIDVNIRYFHTLPYEDGWYSFVFPTVVGPRYNPLRSQSPVAALPREEFGEPAVGRDFPHVLLDVDDAALVLTRNIVVRQRFGRREEAVGMHRHARLETRDPVDRGLRRMAAPEQIQRHAVLINGSAIGGGDH